MLVENQAGWHNLCYLISRARHVMPKGEAMLVDAELTGCTDGLIALSGCRKGKIPAALLAGEACGMWEPWSTGALRQTERVFEPQWTDGQRDERFERWKKAWQ